MVLEWWFTAKTWRSVFFLKRSFSLPCANFQWILQQQWWRRLWENYEWGSEDATLAKRQGWDFGGRRLGCRKRGGFRPGLAQPCSPRAITAVALDCGIKSSLQGSLGPRLLRALKTRVRTLKQICRLGVSGVCVLSVQRGERFWFSSKRISACGTKPPGINWKHWWPFSAERQKQAERLGTRCPYPPVTLVEARVGGLCWRFPHYMCFVNFRFQGCQDKVFRCNYRRVLFSCNRVARIYFPSNHTVPTRRHCLERRQLLTFKCCFSAFTCLLFFHRPRVWQSNCVGYRTLLFKPMEMKSIRKLSQVWPGFQGEFQLLLERFIGLYLMNDVLCFLSILWLMNMKEYLAERILVHSCWLLVVP